MKFKLQGDPLNKYQGPSEDVVHGVTLYRDKFVDVTDEAKIARLKTHSHVASEDSSHPPPLAYTKGKDEEKNGDEEEEDEPISKTKPKAQPKAQPKPTSRRYR